MLVRMSRTVAIVLLTNVALIWLLGLYALAIHPSYPLIPEHITKLASVILAGAAVGIIMISLGDNRDDRRP